MNTNKRSATEPRALPEVVGNGAQRLHRTQSLFIRTTMHKSFLMPGKFFNHGWTRMDTDSVASIRVYPCSSVV